MDTKDVKGKLQMADKYVQPVFLYSSGCCNIGVGQRYVVKSQPSKRGRVVPPIQILGDRKLITLLMDATCSDQCRRFVPSYFYSLIGKLNCFRRKIMHYLGVKTTFREEYWLHEIMPESEYERFGGTTLNNFGTRPSSSKSLSEGDTMALTLHKLQCDFLEYVYNNDFSVGPHFFGYTMSLYNFQSVEQFLIDIPTKILREFKKEQQADTHEGLQIGQRCIVINNYTKKGVITAIFQDANNLIKYGVKLDNTNIARGHKRILQKLLARLCSTIENLFSVNNFQKGDINCFASEDLMLEKRYYRNLIDSIVRRAGKALESNAQTSTGISSTITNWNDAFRPLYVYHEDNEALLHDELGTEFVTDINESISGTRSGIEGSNNSCYLDSMLFCLFYSTTIFDFLLEPKHKEKKYAKACRKILHKQIVSQLRSTLFCGYEQVMDLRMHLSKLNPDLLGSFMDAEQVLYLLCEEVFRENNFIRYYSPDGSDWGDFMHLICIDGNESKIIGSVQECMQRSFNFNSVKLASVPNPAFILGMPRSNRELVHYDAIVPNLVLKLQAVLTEAKCHCQATATRELRKPNRKSNNYSSIPVCETCSLTVSLNEPDLQIVSREEMILQSVVCISGVHFTAFTRYDLSNDNSTWLYFDSMSGAGPEVREVPIMAQQLTWLENQQTQITMEELDPTVRRSCFDCHLCFYEPRILKRSLVNT